MDKKQILQNLQDMNNRLSNIHEIDWLHRLHEVVTCQKKEDTERIKEKVKLAAPGMQVLYVFAVVEEFIPFSIWEQYLDEDDMKLYRAWKHIRNSVAHGLYGKRSKERKKQYEDFDWAMGNKKLPFVRKYNANSFELIGGISESLKPFLKDISCKVQVKIAKELKL